MPGLIDDLLELVGLAGDTVDQVATPTATVGEDPRQRAQKDKLVSDFDRRAEFNPLGATEDQLAEIKRLRIAFGNLASHNSTEVGHLLEAFNKLLEKEAEFTNQIRKIEALRARLAKRVTDAVPEGMAATIVEGALTTESQPLAQERARLLLALQAPQVGTPGKAADKFTALVDAVQKFGEAVSAVEEEAARRRDIRERMVTALAEIGPVGTEEPDAYVPGATALDVRPLVDGVKEAARVQADTQATLEQLDQQLEALGRLKLDKASIADVVEERAARRVELQEQAEAIETGMPDEANAGVLTELLKTISQALSARPLGDDHLKTATDALASLRSDADLEAEDVRLRKVRRAALRKRAEELGALIKQTCAGYEVDPVVEGLKSLTKALNGPLHKIDFDEIEPEPNELTKELDNLLLEVVTHAKSSGKAQPVEYLLRAAAAAVAEGRRLEPFAGRYLEPLQGLPDQGDALRELLGATTDDPPSTPEVVTRGKSGSKKSATSQPKPSKPQPKSNAVKDAFDILAEMRQVIDDARGEVDDRMQALSDLRDSLLERLGAPIPKTLPPGFGRILEALRDDVLESLGEEMTPAITNELLDIAGVGTTRFERDLAAAGELVLQWVEIDGRYAGVLKDARKPLQAQLSARHAALLAFGKKAPLDSDLPGARPVCQALLDYLRRVGSEASQAAAARETLGNLVVGGGKLDPETVSLLYDLAGPEVAALDAPGLQTLGECFKEADKAARTALAEMVSEGFAGEGRMLLALARSGDSKAILQLARDLAGPGNKEHRTRLRDLVEHGGLADAPHVLGDMLGFGVAGAQDPVVQRGVNTARIKALGEAFGDEEGPSRLKLLVADCGLGKARAEVPARPGILAELWQGEAGLGGDATQLRKLADGFAAPGTAGARDRARLKGLVEEGGFGGRPKAFAPLLKSLSSKNNGMDGAVVELKKLGQTFEAPRDRTWLKAVLEGGGMSGDTSDPNRQHEHPDTLAKVFSEGLDGRADKLKNFTDAFGDTAQHTEEARHMLEAWNEFPEASRGSRQPGRMVKRLLAAHHLNGDVSKLQAKFTSRMELFADEGQRKLATRFAPHFDKARMRQADYNARPDPMPDGVDDIIMGYIAQRHLPHKANDGTKQNGQEWLDDPNSYFPVETTPQQLAEIIGKAMKAPGAPGPGGSATVTLPDGMQVHIAVSEDGVIPHCYPVSSKAPPHPDEIACFTKAQTLQIFAAVRP